MSRPIDVFALLKRGGAMTDAECRQLAEEMTEAKLSDFKNSITMRSIDQPVKVLPLSDQIPRAVTGYFSLEKFICGKSPEEMGRVLGAFGKFANGAMIMEFIVPLNPTDFKNRAYTYLPNGEPYKLDEKEKVYLPGTGAPQWTLTRSVQARCLARVKPGEIYIRKPAGAIR